MTTITQRLTAGLTAAIASTAVLGAVLTLFATPTRAEEAVQARPVAVVGGVSAAQRYRAAQGAAGDVKLDLRAATTADVRALSLQAGVRAQASEAAFIAMSNQAAFIAMSNQAAFIPMSHQAAFIPMSNEAAFIAMSHH